MTGVAWLIPYSARHHPLHLKEYGCRGSACSPLSGQEGRRPQTARVITRCNLNSNGYPAHHPPYFLRGGRLGWPSLRASTEHSIRLGLERINPECAVREHNGQPCRPAPFSCVRDARARGISQATATISREAPARNSYFGIRVASLTGGSILI